MMRRGAASFAAFDCAEDLPPVVAKAITPAPAVPSPARKSRRDFILDFCMRGSSAFRSDIVLREKLARGLILNRFHFSGATSHAHAQAIQILLHVAPRNVGAEHHAAAQHS